MGERCFVSPRGWEESLHPSCVVAQGGQGPWKESPPQTHGAISFVWVRPACLQAPQTCLQEAKAGLPPGALLCGVVHGVAFAGTGVQERSPVTQLSPARQGWSQGHLSLHLQGKLITKRGSLGLCGQRPLCTWGSVCKIGAGET